MNSHFFLCFLLLLHRASSLRFSIPQFGLTSAAITYEGDAKPRVGAVDFTDPDYPCHVGRITYNNKVRLWESSSGKISHFSSHFVFRIDTNNQKNYGAGFAFFLSSVDYQIPVNSVGGFLGLYNSTTSSSDGSHNNQLIHVEFDTYPNKEVEPNYEHVGINNNSINSSVIVPWNVTYHSGDNIDAWVKYNGSTKNLTVDWSFQSTPNLNETTTLSMQIDLSKILPEWVKIGFSAATGYYMEQHRLLSWDFTSSLSEEEGSSSSTTRKRKIVIGVTTSLGVLVLALSIGFGVAWRRRQQSEESAMEQTTLATSINDDLERGAGPRRFSYKDLASATSNFSTDRKLGEGGFGAVFRGYLPDHDLVIAVKKISQGSRQGRKEYITEVKIISSLRHRNLVRLIGWCHDNGGQFLLVYEYMPNGSLDAHLFGQRGPLTCSTRYKISLGLASALLYLHEEWEQCVVHRDIKSSNLMLDSNFNAKLGDFGLARLMDHEVAPQTTGLAGTLGYMAPEYISTRRASKESDVYSFGMVLLEIATGRRAVDLVDKNSYLSLLEWVWGLYGSGELLKGVDGRMNKDYDRKQVECLMIVGLWCAHPDRTLRPFLREAIQVLNFNADIPLLPNKMPVLTYHIPTPSLSSGDPLISSIIEEGR